MARDVNTPSEARLVLLLWSSYCSMSQARDAYHIATHCKESHQLQDAASLAAAAG
jgi:hypothetical protein